MAKTKLDKFAENHNLSRVLHWAIWVELVSAVISLATLAYLYHAHQDTANLVHQLQTQIRSLGGKP